MNATVNVAGVPTFTVGVADAPLPIETIPTNPEPLPPLVVIVGGNI